MLYLRVSLSFTLLCFAGVAKAVDLDLSMSTLVGYDDNIFRTDRDTKDDVSFRFGPTVRVRDETSKLAYNLSYNPVYEKFVTWTDADDLSHFVHGALDYQISDRTLFKLSNDFRLAQSLNRGPLVANQDATGGEVQSVPETEVIRKDVYWNATKASMFHNFTAHTQGEFTISHNYVDSERANTSTSNSLSGFGTVMHALSSRDQLGLGAGVTWQRFDGVRGQPQTDSYIFRLTGSWIHNFGQDTELVVRAGPAVIYTEQKAGRPDSEELYPHRFVANGSTIAQAYAAIGLMVPADVQDPDGNPLMGSDPLGDGSVLIPQDTKCLQGMVLGQTVFQQSNCSFNVVVDRDNGAFTGLADTISGAGNVPLNYVGDNGGDDDTDITAFGEVTISHSWFPDLSSTASYSRSDSAATTLGSTTISDRVLVETRWTPTRRWDLRVRGDWLRRKSANDVTNDFVVIAGTDAGGFGYNIVTSTGLVAARNNNSVDTEYWRVAGRAAYRTSRRSTVSLRASYQQQETDRGTSRTNSTFENFIIILGFRYDLDPFHF